VRQVLAELCTCITPADVKNLFQVNLLYKLVYSLQSYKLRYCRRDYTIVSHNCRLYLKFSCNFSC